MFPIFDKQFAINVLNQLPNNEYPFHTLLQTSLCM